MKRKAGRGKASVILSTETQTNSLLAILLTDGRLCCEHHHPTSSAEDKREKRALHYSNAWSNRTIRTIWMKGKPSGRGWTKPWQNPFRTTTWLQSWKFTETLSGLSKDTGPGPDNVKYSDFKNMSIDNKNKLFRLYEESFATGQVSEVLSHSYLKPIPNQAMTIASWTDTVSWQCKTPWESWWGESWPGMYFSQTKEGREHKNPLWKTQPDSHTMSTKDSRGRNKLW